MVYEVSMANGKSPGVRIAYYLYPHRLTHETVPHVAVGASQTFHRRLRF